MKERILSESVKVVVKGGIVPITSDTWVLARAYGKYSIRPFRLGSSSVFPVNRHTAQCAMQGQEIVLYQVSATPSEG
jgi:hypothetical protein